MDIRMVVEARIPESFAENASPFAVFIDRDGVINENRSDHVKGWAEFHFIPGAREALARLAQAGARVFVVSNQAIVGRGIVPADTIDGIHAAMIADIELAGGRIEAVAYCPHQPEDRCACRKPNPGLLVELARRYGVDLRRAVMVGDAVTDMQAAQAVGCPGVLVLTGRGTEQLARAPIGFASALAVVVADLGSAVELLITERQRVFPPRLEPLNRFSISR
jgi:D-glycero-D-manno-heptose 1,7-bisphosphate phosphatase